METIMAQGSVQINNLNLGQGFIDEVERTFLFVGHVPAANGVEYGKLLTANTQTDFDDLLGAASSVLKTNLAAAALNAGQNWQAYVLPLGDDATILTEIEEAVSICNPEAVVSLFPVSSAAEIAAYQAKLYQLRASKGAFQFCILTASGITPESQTWADYRTTISELVTHVAADMVSICPQLHGNDAGIYAGRLCNRATSIADSPMRFDTGAVLGLGTTPVDKNGKALPDSLLADFTKNMRVSCIQRYVGMPGTYWADGMMLDTPGGDYQVIENVRVMLKAMRAVRVLAIRRIANRILNATPASIAAHKQYFARPLRDMSKSATFMGYNVPGEIYPPADDAVNIVWQSKNKVELYLKLRPYESPKEIVANLALDLSEA